MDGSSASGAPTPAGTGTAGSMRSSMSRGATASPFSSTKRGTTIRTRRPSSSRDSSCRRPAGLAAYADVDGVGHGLAEREPPGAGPARQLGHRGLPHPPLGHVDDPPPADLVVRIDQHLQIGHDVLDLATVVELGAPHHLVGHLGVDHGPLEGSGLGVGPVEDGHVAPPQSLVAAEADDLVGHPLGLVVLVLGPVPDDLLPHPAVGPQRLGLAGDVVGDHGVGGVEDGLGGAEVLVQGDGGGVGEGLLEVEDVGDVRPPEPVDRLVAVPHHHDVAVLTGQAGRPARSARRWCPGTRRSGCG